MAQIRFKSFKDDSDFPLTQLPPGATCFREPENMSEMAKKSLIFMLPCFVLILLSMFLKTAAAGQPVVEPLFIPAGIAAGWLLFIPHELLHAVACPRKSVVQVGLCKKSFSFVALPTAPFTRLRFAVFCLLPFVVLGLVPFAAFLLSPAGSLVSNAFLFGISAMGLTSPCADFLNVKNMLSQVPHGAYIQASGFHFYWFARCEEGEQ